MRTVRIVARSWLFGLSMAAVALGGCGSRESGPVPSSQGQPSSAPGKNKAPQSQKPGSEPTSSTAFRFTAQDFVKEFTSNDGTKQFEAQDKYANKTVEVSGTVLLSDPQQCPKGS